MSLVIFYMTLQPNRGIRSNYSFSTMIGKYDQECSSENKNADIIVGIFFEWEMMVRH
ncbi:hypothetical protein VCHA49P379_30196 [Vibrio chagasii]|nr:hypothetical protein VCHA35P150_120148 [Vibrio chagasii]CAH6839640.1 hypothetical protein VCHA34O109_170102 [Vibrio chagasii]CAH7012820.1 hypothetical protein VCHA38O206_140149 [Vibrio chagasii]CAH7293271.1 hypothetical protein VCHA49P379_30196 [Vibrio chagasii]CAH7403616.1 hypothetical protein VCHA37O177_20372 [Vibrio chagasii]